MGGPFEGSAMRTLNLELSLDPGDLQTEGLGFRTQWAFSYSAKITRLSKKSKSVILASPNDIPIISLLNYLPHYPVDTSAKKCRDMDASLSHSRFHLEERDTPPPLLIALSVSE